jgi:uncharacterized protein (TIGR02117 family)
MIKKWFIRIAKFFLWTILALILYVGFAFLMNKFEVDGNPDPNGKIAVWTSSNGSHTDIIVPTVTSQLDWRSFVTPLDTRSADSSISYISFGWGDKEFFLNTPTWGDLTASTALKAASGLGSGAVHVTYIGNPEFNPSWRKMMLNEKQYAELIHFIQQSFLMKEGKVVVIPTEARYGNNDAFYESTKSYSLFYTCNTWTHEGLDAAEQAHCPWTILAF